MALAVAVAVAAGLLVGEVTVGAHRLDEYLQAARVSVAPNRLDVDWELSPGVAVAERVRRLLDCDGDGRVSEAEADALPMQEHGALSPTRPAAAFALGNR